jgi:membrane protease subunit HflK
VEKVMENSSKVMVDVEGGNNLLYLPLDKIINSARDDRGFTNQGAPDSARAPARSFDSDRRSRDSRGRTR